MIKAVIFDLDGTLINSEALLAQALQRVLAKRTQLIDLNLLYEICWGRSWRGIHQNLQERGHVGNLTMDELVLLVDDEMIGTPLPQIPGSVNLVKYLKGKVPMSIVSGSTRKQIAEAIEQCELQDCFDFYLGAEDYDSGKPSPECYFLAAKHLKLEPAECLVFEDSEAGVQAAKDAGMQCVALSPEGKFDLSKADTVLKDLSEFDTSDIESTTCYR